MSLWMDDDGSTPLWNILKEKPEKKIFENKKVNTKGPDEPQVEKTQPVLKTSPLLPLPETNIIPENVWLED